MNDPQKKYRLGTVSKNTLLEGLNWFHSANRTLTSDVNVIECMLYVCIIILLDFSLNVKAAPHECAIRTSQP